MNFLSVDCFDCWGHVSKNIIIHSSAPKKLQRTGSQVVLLDRTNSIDLVHVGSRTDNLQPHTRPLLYSLIRTHVSRWIRRRVELHIRRNQVGTHKHRQGPHVSKKTHLVHRGHHSIHNLTLKRLPHHRPVLHLKLSHSRARDDPAPAHVDIHTIQNTHNVAKLTCACTLNVQKKFISQVLVHLRAKVRRMERQVQREVFKKKHDQRMSASS